LSQTLKRKRHAAEEQIIAISNQHEGRDEERPICVAAITGSVCACGEAAFDGPNDRFMFCDRGFVLHPVHFPSVT
jgi:hypothetical protein